jgi:hypothetical protein
MRPPPLDHRRDHEQERADENRVEDDRDQAITEARGDRAGLRLGHRHRALRSAARTTRFAVGLLCACPPDPRKLFFAHEAFRGGFFVLRSAERAENLSHGWTVDYYAAVTEKT